MFFIFIIGPAGSGKSTLVGAFSDWMLDHDLDVATINLDPGASWMPYRPDVDVRDYVTVEEVMEKYNLGPNGAIIAAADLIAVEAGKIRDEIEGLKADYILVDTPGQMELFAFRAAGPHIASVLCKDSGAMILFLIDAIFASRPTSLVSALLLSASVHFRFLMPQLNLLTKVDMVDKKRVEHICYLVENSQALIEAVSMEAKGPYREMHEKLCELIASLGSISSIFPVSSITGEGIDSLYAEIQRISAGGEDYVTYY
ncbi:MAG: GTPase [Thermoprotei archaeon]|nr:MAG: GTPase [Thermoprotei archaeon]